MIFLTPSFNKNFVIAIPAEPAPLITTLILLISLLTILRALINAAPVTVAVPC